MTWSVPPRMVPADPCADEGCRCPTPFTVGEALNPCQATSRNSAELDRDAVPHVQPPGTDASREPPHVHQLICGAVRTGIIVHGSQSSRPVGLHASDRCT